MVNGGILEVKSEFISNGLIFTGSAKQETTRMPSIRIPKGLLNERSDGESMSVYAFSYSHTLGGLAKDYLSVNLSVYTCTLGKCISILASTGCH